MNILSKINELSTDPFISDIAYTVGEIAKKYAINELPSGPATDLHGAPWTLAESSSIGEWGGREDEATYAWNSAIDTLYQLIDIRHIGSNVFYTTHTSGDFPENWDEYENEARAEIEHWLNYSAWDQFCRDPYRVCE